MAREYTTLDQISLSIILPCRNEEDYISKCLESILDRERPYAAIELLVVDGMSTDRTREIVRAYAKEHPFIRLLDNPKGIVPTGMNIGIKAAKGEIIMRLDAHTTYAKGYFMKSIKYLFDYQADNVGGLFITQPGADTIQGHAIAMALSHIFGVGNSHFRLGSEKPREVDTVPFGCYHRDVFTKIGGYNEHLVRNQDIELNLRLRRTGGKVILAPDVMGYYYARPDYTSLFGQNFANGLWVIYSMRFAKIPFSIRHIVPLCFLSALLLTLALSFTNRYELTIFIASIAFYLCINLLVSALTAFKKGIAYFPYLALAFVTLHFSYGFGSIYGAYRLIKVAITTGTFKQFDVYPV